MAKHLDSEYRRRWEEYIFYNGDKILSRNINWRDIPNWNELEFIKIYMLGKWYIEHSNHPNFKGFVRLRTCGYDKVLDTEKQLFKKKPIYEWCIGWTDGVKVYLQVIDFFTGKKVRDEVRTYQGCLGHLHPTLK